MMGLNESALRNSNFEESYFKTMFYVKTVEKVELRRHAVILQLKTAARTEQPMYAPPHSANTWSNASSPSGTGSSTSWRPRWRAWRGR